MHENQVTIKNNVLIDGIGLHSGAFVKLALCPAKEDEGIFFIRTDLRNSKPIFADWKNIVPANLCTKICNKKGEYVNTIEHLMFSFYSLGITNLKIEIDGPEVPILDGSSKIFIDYILKTGLQVQKKKINKIKIHKKIYVKENNKFIQFEPTNCNNLDINYLIDYNDLYIKKQKYVLKDCKKNFSKISNCRTFCHQEDLEKIFAMGLAKGGSLDNAIVISGTKILNQDGLRCKDEFVKHKILDCLGDLYLSKYFINGKITCVQGGHELTARLLKKIFENNKNYSVVPENRDNSNTTEVTNNFLVTQTVF